MLQHEDIWRAVDRLAERHGLSASGLARKAGLSATLFNPSKRINGKRKRWPSTESIAAIIKATNCSLDSFVALASPDAQQHKKLPLLDCRTIKDAIHFDAAGKPTGDKWDEANLPGANDPDSFIVEITGTDYSPTFHEGDRLLFSPLEKPRRGDRVGVKTKQGDFLIKILGREGAQKIELLSIGKEEAPLTFGREELSWLYRLTWASQ